MNLVGRPPEPGLLIAVAAKRLRWITVLGEWLHNCLDADANHIEIVIRATKEHFPGFKDSREFVVARPPRGLGASIELLQRMLKD